MIEKFICVVALDDGSIIQHQNTVKVDFRGKFVHISTQSEDYGRVYSYPVYRIKSVTQFMKEEQS